MAQKSDLKSCLMWELVLPQYGGSVQSSHFRLLGEEWYLKMSLVLDTLRFYHYIIYLCRREGAKTLESALSTTCCVVVESWKLYNSDQRTVQKSGDTVKDFIPPSNSPLSSKCTVYCRLSCVEPLLLQINNEKMLILSVDDNVCTCKAHLQGLSDDFSRLLKEEIEPDATLTCSGQTWKVHKSVLTVRSEVFAAMFRSGMTESRTGAVRVEDLEAPVLDSLLKYVYHGEVPDLSGESVSGLYEAGDRYALHGLRKACSDWMVKNLSDDNCLSFLVTADAHGDAKLREDVESFIAEHYAEIGEETWSDFTKKHPFLAIAVLQRFAPSKKKK